jgi:hypothetical protein
MAEWANAETFGMGDRYRETEHGVTHLVRWVQSTGSGKISFLHSDGTQSENFGWSKKVRLISRAPLCGCGRRYENCVNDCFWPRQIEDAYFGRI